jgi:hypothetical protein
VARNGMIHQDGEIFADIVRILSDFLLKLKEVLSFRVKAGPFSLVTSCAGRGQVLLGHAFAI